MKKRKSIPNAIAGSALGFIGIYLFYTAMKLHMTGGIIEVHSKGEGWMEAWQCYAAGTGLLVIGILLVVDSIRLIDASSTPSPERGRGS